MDRELRLLLSNADRALGRLDGVGSILPNPDLFVAMYVRHEAVLSSQIEGTQSTLEDVLAYEVEGDDAGLPRDVSEVVNYINAMNFGIKRLDELPLCTRLLREIHGHLMRGVRGGEKDPGEVRQIQNWIGPPGCTTQTAAFVPPPPTELDELLTKFERFLHDRESLEPLVQVALAHAQFETIHPFLDGNGRVGRLLITLLLMERKILSRPLLYLSIYLKMHRAEYYDRLTAIRRDGDWEGWLRFFLRGVAEVSASASATAGAILALRERSRAAIESANGLRLLDNLFQQPVTHVRHVERVLGCTFATANRLVQEMEKLGLLREMTGHKRNRRYQFYPYLRLFDHVPVSVESQEEQVTQDDSANP